MRPTPVPEQLRGRPFTWPEAQAAGVSKHAVRSSAYRHVFLNVWAAADVPDSREFRLAAVRLVLPGHAVLCGLTAAWLWGCDVRREGDLEVHVGLPKGKRVRQRPGLRVCQETLDASDWVVVDGVRVTTPLRTAFDCMRWLHGHERLVVADAMTHLGVVSVPDLRRYFASKRRLRNLRRGEALLDDVEPKAESPMETRMRCELVLGGLPRPEAQIEVHTTAGTFVGRVDLGYPELKIAIEFDGAWHWAQRRADDRRRQALREQGWVVLVFHAEDVFNSPMAMCATVARALRARAA